MADGHKGKCALCHRHHEEPEPRFMRYVLGAVDGHLCGECAKPICDAVAAGMVKRAAQLRAAMLKQARTDAANRRRDLRAEARRMRLERALRSASRLIGLGAEPDAALRRAAFTYGVPFASLADTWAKRATRRPAGRPQAGSDAGRDDFRDVGLSEALPGAAIDMCQAVPAMEVA